MRRGRDSAVGIATRYRLGGPGIESRWGRDIPPSFRSALGSTQPPIQWVPRHFPGGKPVGTGRWQPTPSIVEVKERVDLCIYSTYGLSWAVIGWTLPCLSPLSIFMCIDSVNGHTISILQMTPWPSSKLYCCLFYTVLFKSNSHNGRGDLVPSLSHVTVTLFPY
jgi:hypothetical protein